MTGRSFTVAVGLAFWCAGWAHATAVSTDTFNLDFFAENGSWNDDASFGVTVSSTWNTSDENGYTQNQLCPDKDWWSCICDPGVKLSVPDQPTPTTFNPEAGIELGADGTFNENFINTGSDIAMIIFSTTDFKMDETYTCSSPYNNSPYLQFFQFCGFKIVDPPGTPDTLYIDFGDPINTVGITSATPEPNQDVLLLIAVGAVAMVQRIRSRRANG